MSAAMIGLVAVAYLLGSIPFGLIIGRLRGVDVRTVGSGNIGASNVARNMGKRIGALVLLLDAAKGALAMALPLFWGGKGLGTAAISDFHAAVGLAAIFGHCFPVWLKFRGGKGVATALGVFAVADPVVTGAAVLLWVTLYAWFRIASVGSMIVAIGFPLALYALDRPPPMVWMAAVAAALILFRHRGNLMRLLRREEHKV
jgi:glycerol-3-phosphate acyltransferase PlsY